MSVMTKRNPDQARWGIVVSKSGSPYLQSWIDRDEKRPRPGRDQPSVVGLHDTAQEAWSAWGRLKSTLHNNHKTKKKS